MNRTGAVTGRSPSHEEGIRAAEVICMVIRGEIRKSDHSLAIVADAVQTIYAYNGLRLPGAAFRVEPGDRAMNWLSTNEPSSAGEGCEA